MKGLLLALLLSSHIVPASAAVDDLPCVACHPSRDRTAYQILSRTAGVHIGQESAQEFVCRSCHEGVVRDDRQKLSHGGQHPVGVSAGMATPSVFPLYGDRRLECGTCHTPHGQGDLARRWLRMPFAGGGLCISCHGDHGEPHLGSILDAPQAAAVAGLGGRVGEAGKIECGTCHLPHEAAGAKLLLAPYGPDQDGLCRTCHAGLSVKGVEAAGSGPSCASCHKPHLEATWQLRGELEGPCITCHTGRAAGGEHPSAAPGCSECHSVHSPVRPGGSAMGLLRMPTAGGLLCRSCHQADHGVHGGEIQVSAEVSAALRAKGLPTAGEEAGCATCHRMHTPRDVPLLRMPQSIVCLYCHPEENPFGPTGQRPGVHPMAVLLDAAQGSELQAGGGRVGPDGELACNSCHRAHGDGSGIRPACVTCHPAQSAVPGHAGDGACITCHAMHGEDPDSHSCGECHGEVAPGPHRKDQELAAAALPALDEQGRLSQVGTLQCVTCHDPHGQAAPLLRRESHTAVCAACHPGKGAVAGSSHAVSATPGSLCEPCHPSHGAVPLPTGEDPAADRCLSCHGEQRRVGHGHSRQGSPPWSRLTADLPLFDQAGQQNPYGFISCPTCHDVHTAAEQRSMRAEHRDPPQLCLGCHQEKASLLGSSHDPRRSGSEATCTVCHPPHPEQEGPAIWLVSSVAQGTWNDRKCTPCHGTPDDTPWGYADDNSHPVNILLPQHMKAGALPLFDALGGSLGRGIACTTCHDLHGTPAGNGGSAPLFLRLDPTSGELCTTCHRTRSSILGTPHDIAGDPDFLGPCSPCHVAHGATSSRALWWLEPAPGEYEPNRLCRSCHRQGGLAGRDPTLMQHHMKDAEEVFTKRGTIYLQRPMLLVDELAQKLGDEPVIPLFERDGTAGPRGNLQCVSCHEPHQWSPMGPFVKPGFGTLGPNVPTKFLRLDDDQKAQRSVCVACHQNDAPRRYKEYHQVWSDVGEGFR